MDIDLTPAIEAARTDLSKVESEIEVLTDQQRDLEARADDIRAEIHGLELAQKRYSGVPPVAEVEEDRQLTRWRRMPRTDAIVAVLREEGPLGPSGIRKALVERGRSDSAHKVSASLTHLQHRNRVQNPRFGEWVAVTSESPAQLSVDSADSGGDA